MQKKNGQNVFTPTSSFCSTPPPPSPIAHPLLPRSGVSYVTGNATLRACGSSGRMADNALPQVMSATRLIPRPASTSVVSTRRSTLLYDGKISISRMIQKFEVSEDSDHFPQHAVGSQRSVASTVPALINLDSLSSTGKQAQCDGSVANVNRNLSRTQVDRDQNSGDRPSLRKYIEVKVCDVFFAQS